MVDEDEVIFDLIMPSQVPPGGWRYVSPESGVAFEEDDLDACVAKLHEHECANAFELTDREVVRQSTLAALVDTHPHYVKVSKWGGRSLSSYWKGLNGLALIMKLERSGRPIQVSHTHATKRAEICAECPYNTKPPKSVAMKATDDLMVRLAGGRKFDQALHNCAVCSCPLLAKVNLTVEVLKAGGDVGGDFPKWCWVRKELNSP